jgi:hypothetical protein
VYEEAPGFRPFPRSARHIIWCNSTQKTRLQSAVDDVASNINFRQALVAGSDVLSFENERDLLRSWGKFLRSTAGRCRLTL